MSENRLTFNALNVSDLERSIKFYRDVIGVPLHEASHDAELNDRWYGGDHAAIDTAYARLLASGYQVVQEARDEPWGRSARILDSDGNIVSITAA